MYTRHRITKILDGLRAFDAIMLVYHDRDGHPRIHLRPWVGPYRYSVSIGTAERVLDDLEHGRLHKPLRRASQSLRTHSIETKFTR